MGYDWVYSTNTELWINRPSSTRGVLMKNNYWLVAEKTNGRLAMIGLFALIINYGFFGWIIPGIY